MSTWAVEGRAMNAVERAAHMRAWFKSARREFRVLGLPVLAPVQIASALHQVQMPWLMAEHAADQKLEVLRQHLHTCAQPDPEAQRLFEEYWHARSDAESLGDGRRTLTLLELDYLRPLCWGNAWRDQAIEN